MRYEFALVLATGIAFGACSVNGDARPTAGEGRGNVKVIKRDVLRNVASAGGTVAIVRVTGAEILRRGTRGESVSIEAQVVETILGDPGASVGIRRYTSGGDTVLESGRLYAVALEPVPRVAPSLFLTDYVAVAEDSVAVSAEKHRAAIAKLVE